MSEEKVAEEAAVPSFVELLKNFEGAPDQVQIDAWKGQFGDVFCSAFSETELYIWRPLNRQEWREHQVMLSQAETQVDPFQIEEEVVGSCMLWMSTPGEKALTLKAGSASTLHEQLLQNSNFVDPRLASNLVVKL